jgi:MFS family permease
MKGIVRNRSLLLLGAAEIINSVGSWITSMALYSLLIFQQHGGLGQSTAIFLAGLGPSLVLSPLAGWLCDRLDRRPLMIISRLLQGAVITCLIFTDKLPFIYALLALNSVFGTVMTPAKDSSLPELVTAEDLPRANAFMQQATGIVKIIAPALAGALLTVLAPHTAMILDVVSYAVAAAILTGLPALPPRGAAPGERRDSGEATGGGGSLLAGLHTLLRLAPGLALLLPLNLLMALVLISFDIAIAVYVRDILQTGIAYKGIMGGMVGTGTILGTGAFFLLEGRRNPWRDLLGGLLLVTALPAALAAGGLWLAPAAARAGVAAGCFVGGLGIGIVNVQGATLFQRLAPRGWLGRLGGIFQSLLMVGQLAGIFLTPLLVPHVVSFGVYFGIATVLLLTANLLTALGIARLGRRQLAPEADAAGEVRVSEG